MAGAIQGQADVGALSLQGLGAFSTVLATLSADNVAPVAMIQLEQLGSMLPTNGDYAERVKSLLQRCSNVRLDRLTPLLGWRKNDSASLMANTAGGQAVALLSMCLVNLFKASDVGCIFSRLCSDLFSGSMKRTSIASVSQMADAAVLLTGKLDTLGWGNILAREIWKIYRAYEALGKDPPRGLLEQLNVEYVIELLVNVSRALCEEEKICRISGSWGMGHVLGLVQVLFPRSTMVTVESTVLQNVENLVIKLEFQTQNSDDPTLIHLETRISGLFSTIELLKIERSMSVEWADLHYRFRWDGWLADLIEIRLLDAGLEAGQTLLDACCEYLMFVPSAIRMDTSKDASARNSFVRKKPDLHSIPLIKLLGPLARARMSNICEVVWRSRPKGNSSSLRHAFTKLIDVVGGILRAKSCTCHRKCDRRKPEDFYPRDGVFHALDYDSCPIRIFWKIIGYALSCGLWTFFIDAGQDTVVCAPRNMGLWPISRARHGSDVHMGVSTFIAGAMSYIGLQSPSAARELITLDDLHYISEGSRNFERAFCSVSVVRHRGGTN